MTLRANRSAVSGSVAENKALRHFFFCRTLFLLLLFLFLFVVVVVVIVWIIARVHDGIYLLNETHLEEFIGFVQD